MINGAWYEVIDTRPMSWCQYENTLCEFANDMGYCKVTACINQEVRNKKLNKYVTGDINMVELNNE